MERWCGRICSYASLNTPAVLSIFQSSISQECFMGSFFQGRESEQPFFFCFGLLSNFIGRGSSSTVKRIFNNGQQYCVIGRKVSEVMTLTDKQYTSAFTAFVSVFKHCIEKSAYWTDASKLRIIAGIVYFLSAIMLLPKMEN